MLDTANNNTCKHCCANFTYCNLSDIKIRLRQRKTENTTNNNLCDICNNSWLNNIPKHNMQNCNNTTILCASCNLIFNNFGCSLHKNITTIHPAKSQFQHK